ncbi:chromate efflux transporter [Bosea vaviloviae]|uniref:chromate efflux transporter n=1 Tax=Bosea vaviloviae TaxID=1526658 RepID=UPI000B1F7822
MTEAARAEINPTAAGERRIGTAGEVFSAFLKLGLTSFGGPIAHLGYFRDEFVVRRGWLSEPAYADLVALCQFLPGPASSQVGMAIGLSRAGYLGAAAAWTAFTLPSALVLVAFAYGVTAMGDLSGAGWLHGLKVAAVAVVAVAILGMARSLTPDRERATIAVVAAALALAVPTAWGQVAVILLGAAAGLALPRPAVPEAATGLPLTVSRRAALAALGLFAVLLIGLPALAAATGARRSP